MGCWYNTCYISKLPIFSDEDIVLILLRENKYRQSSPFTCCPQDNFVPFGLPIYGKYDEYGGIEDITNKEDVLDYLNSVEIFHEKDEKIEFSLKNLEDNINHFLCDDYYYRNHETFYKIEGLMVKRSLYDRLINHYKKRLDWDGNTYEDVIKEKVFDAAKKIKNDSTLSESDKEFDFKWKILNYLRIGNIDEDKDIFPVLKRKIFEKDLEKDKNYFLEILFFKLCLQALRMGYYCISGNGSQSIEMLIHREVANFILEETEKAIKDYKENNDDDATYQEILSEKLFF